MKEWFEEHWPEVIIILLFLMILLVKCSGEKSDPSPVIKETIIRIDSIQTQIDSVEVVKDSIIYKIEKVYEQIEHVDTVYKEKYITIINNNSSEDYEFFINYINANRSRLDSCIQSRFKIYEFDICRTRETND